MSRRIGTAINSPAPLSSTAHIFYFSIFLACVGVGYRVQRISAHKLTSTTLAFKLVCLFAAFLFAVAYIFFRFFPAVVTHVVTHRLRHPGRLRFNSQEACDRAKPPSKASSHGPFNAGVNQTANQSICGTNTCKPL